MDFPKKCIRQIYQIIEERGEEISLFHFGIEDFTEKSWPSKICQSSEGQEDEKLITEIEEFPQTQINRSANLSVEIKSKPEVPNPTVKSPSGTLGILISEKGTFEFPKERIGQCTGDMIEECYTRNNTYGEEDLQPCQNSVNLQFERSVQDDEVEDGTERISEKSQEQITVSLGNPEDPNSSEYHNCKSTRVYQEEEKRDLVSRKGLTPVTRPPWSESKGFGKEADAKKVRSLTLGRMGKMMMMRKSGKEKDGCDPRQGMSERASSDLYKDQISMKERANSLGRMLKLVDKDGAPRKLFSDHRAGSLTGIFYKKNNQATATASSSDPQAHSTGIFAKVLNQLRGRGKIRGHHGMPEDNTNMDENKGLSKENYLSRKSALASRIMGNLTLGGSKKSCSGRETNPEHSERDTN